MSGTTIGGRSTSRPLSALIVSAAIFYGSYPHSLHRSADGFGVHIRNLTLTASISPQILRFQSEGAQAPNSTGDDSMWPFALSTIIVRQSAHRGVHPGISTDDL